jgi:two-component system, chemotaxis family, sensor kinase CheA
MADDDFTKQLQEACRAEGQEHVQLLLASLVKLEYAGIAEAPPLVEQSFRSLHNLKGSAHAAEFYTIESLCHPMEDIMSAIKSGNLAMNSQVIDLLLEGVGLVEVLFRDGDGAGAAYSTAAAGILSKLKVVLGASSSSSNLSSSSEEKGADQEEEDAPASVAPPPEAKAPISEPIVASQAAQAVEAAATGDRQANQETLRIPAQKLDALLQQAEEMLSLKALVRQNAVKLDDLRRSIDNEAKDWSKAAEDIAQARSMINLMQAVPSGPQEQLAWEIISYSLKKLDELLSDWPSTIRDLCRDLNDCSHSTNNAVDDLLDEAKGLLMNPCSSLFNGFPVLVRKLARQLGKQVEIDITGGDIELDKRILGELKDPLIHLLRNSLDHGIESPEERQAKGKSAKGSLHISAAQVDRMVELRLADDGRGIDSSKVKASAVKQGILSQEEAGKLLAHEALRLIFKSALSTSSTITEISGRGLGLAIVEEKIQQLGGTIEVETVFGKGTTFVLRLPLTIATFRGVLVEVAGKTMAVPTTNIERVVLVSEDAIKGVDGTDTFLLDDGLVPLRSMQEMLRLPASFKKRSEGSQLTVGVVRAGSEKVGLIVDEVLGEQEVLVKSLGPVFAGVTTVLGVTVLGSGQVVPILNVVDMLRTFRDRRGRSSVLPEEGEPTGGQSQSESAVNGGQTVSKPQPRSNSGATGSANVLVVDDMVTARMLMRNILETAGFNVKTANNGAEAFALLQQEPFDIVVTDVEMPVMDGIGLTESIRADERLNSLPVVIVTNMASRQDRERGVKAGANAYFTKNSFDGNNLLDVIWKLV